MFRISPPSITVVVQGPVTIDLTKRCLDSIRQYLPGAHIILSTWTDSPLENLDYDTLVLNQDPGGFPLFWEDSSNILNNVNRQIKSTLTGLKKVKTKYTLKIRTDMALTGTGFLNYFGKYPKSKKTILNDRVLTCSFFTRNPRHKKTPLPFHPSDWFFFGKTQDILNIWDVPLMPVSDQNYFSKASPAPSKIFKYLKSRFFPEQFIWISFLKKHLSISCRHALDISNENIELSEQSFANNLVILPLQTLNLRFLKGSIAANYRPDLIYTYQGWKTLYNNHCGARAFLNPVDIQKISLTLQYQRPKISRKIISHLIKSPKKILTRCLSAFVH